MYIGLSFLEPTEPSKFKLHTLSLRHSLQPQPICPRTDTNCSSSLNQGSLQHSRKHLSSSMSDSTEHKQVLCGPCKDILPLTAAPVPSVNGTGWPLATSSLHSTGSAAPHSFIWHGKMPERWEDVFNRGKLHWPHPAGGSWSCQHMLADKPALLLQAVSGI